ncbi:MAG TPA: hypothetical protein VF772_20985, partial [Terriglobales bacterium]
MKFNRTTRRVLEDPIYGTQPIAGIGAATGAAQRAASTAAGWGGTYGTEGQTIGSMLVPELMGDVRNAPGFGEATMANMLTMGLGGAGGVASGIAGEAGLQAARSRNVGGTAGILDEAAREKMRTSAGVGLDVATKNAMLQQQQRASALKQLENMYGTNVSASLKAQELVPQDIDAWAKANQTGWVQNVDQTIGA